MIDTVFYNQERSGYEELLSYGPYFYRDILEMDTNYKFAGSTLDIMAEGLETIIRDQFVDSADEETISRMERWLEILVKEGRTLEDRRKKVKLIWNGGEKLSGKLIKNMVKSYTGCDETPEVRMTTFLSVKAQAKEENVIYLSDLLEQMERMKPAHIRLEFSVVFSSKIKFCTKLSHHLFHYDQSGTKPDIATHGSYVKTNISADSELHAKLFNYRQSSENAETGIFPYISTVGAAMSGSFDVPDIYSNEVFSFVNASKHEESGTFPNVMMVGHAYETPMSVITAETNVVHTFDECGTIPDIATVGNGEQSGLSLKTESSAVIHEYVECGSKSCGEEEL
ncbi:MAG: DUF2313 domain-containing protein [Hespellia sp.]|nr:DUF2313 domain-containing protein [Hespellia sp.]